MFKLFDFVHEFSEFRQSDDLSRFGCQNIEDNLIRLEKHGKIYFKNKIAVCPSCNSRNTVKNGTYERKLIFLRIGEQICTILIQILHCLLLIVLKIYIRFMVLDFIKFDLT